MIAAAAARGDTSGPSSPQQAAASAGDDPHMSESPPTMAPPNPTTTAPDAGSQTQTASQNAAASSSAPPRARRNSRGKPMRRLTADQTKVLTVQWNKDPHPPTLIKQKLAQQLGMELAAVTKWFVNRRARGAVSHADTAASAPSSKPGSKKRKSSSTSAESRHSSSSKRKKKHVKSSKKEKVKSSASKTRKRDSTGMSASTAQAAAAATTAAANAALTFAHASSALNSSTMQPKVQKMVTIKHMNYEQEDEGDLVAGRAGGIAAAAAAMNSDDEAEMEFWDNWTRAHSDQISSLPYGGETVEFFDREVWQRRKPSKRRPQSLGLADDDLSETTDAALVSEAVECKRRMPTWKQIFIATHPLVSILESRAAALAERSMLNRIAWARADSGLPPVFAVFRGPCLAGNSQYVMEEETLILGRTTDSKNQQGAVLDNTPFLGIGMDDGISLQHARLRIDTASRGFLLENLAASGIRVMRVKRPTSLSTDALNREATATGVAESGPSGGSTASSFELEEAISLNAIGAHCALPNPAVLVFPGSVIIFQIFVAAEERYLPTAHQLSNRLRSQQGLAVSDAELAVESGVKDEGRVGASYVEMLTHAILAHGNQATFREILEYIAKRFSEIVVVRGWKDSLGAVLASTPRFEGLPPLASTVRGRGRVWRLVNADAARASLVEPFVTEDWVAPQIFAESVSAEKQLVSRRATLDQGINDDSHAHGSNARMLVVPAVPQALVDSPEPSSNLDAALTAMLTMRGYNVVREVADEVERRYPEWVASKTRNWRVSSVPGSLREGAGTYWERRAPVTNKNEYRTYRSVRLRHRTEDTAQISCGSASVHAHVSGTAREDATTSEEDDEDWAPPAQLRTDDDEFVRIDDEIEDIKPEQTADIDTDMADV